MSPSIEGNPAVCSTRHETPALARAKTTLSLHGKGALYRGNGTSASLGGVLKVGKNSLCRKEWGIGAPPSRMLMNHYRQEPSHSREGLFQWYPVGEYR